MDPQQEFIPATLGVPREKRKLLIAVLLTGAISSVVSLVFVFYVPKLKVTPDVLVAVSFGTPLHNSLYVVNQKTHYFESLTMKNSEGNTLYATSVASGEGGTRYFLLAKTAHEYTNTNLYARATDGTLVQLTSSDSLKRNLSYDNTSKTFVYDVLASDGSAVITTYDETDKKEVTLSKGENPVIITGGGRILFQEGTELIQLNTASRATSTLATLPKNASYAVNPETGDVAIYNGVTGKIDYFKSVYGFSLTYEKSDPFQRILSFTYDKNQLLFLTLKAFAHGSVYRLGDSQGAETLVFPSKENIGEPQRIYTYE